MSTLSNILNSFLKHRAAYLSDVLYRFSESNNSLSLVAASNVKGINSAPRLLILGREHYFETSKLYPIANRSEVKKAALLDDISAPYTGKRLFSIHKVDEQSHRVNFWIIPNSVIEQYGDSVKIVLPESYVWAKSIEQQDNFININCTNRSLIVYNGKRKLSSGLIGKGIRSVGEFALVSGLSQPDENEVFITADNQCKYLVSGLKNITVEQWPGFWLSAQGEKKANFPWRAIVSTTMACGIVYLLITSGWILYKDNQLNTELDSQRLAINEALDSQKDYLNIQQQNALLAEPLSSQEPHWRVWLVVKEIASTGAKIRAIDYRFQKVTIDASTAKGSSATSVLELLTNNPLITDAHFSKPISRSLGQEVFSIRFSLAASELVDENTANLPSSSNSKEVNNE